MGLSRNGWNPQFWQHLQAPAGTVKPTKPAEAEGGPACLIQVWPAAEAMPVAAAERRRRANGTREECRRDILAAVRSAGRPLTRKQVLRALREVGTPHGAGTVGKALAELTAAGELVNPRDKRGYRLAAWPRRACGPSVCLGRELCNRGDFSRSLCASEDERGG